MKRLLVIASIAVFGAAACTTPPAGGGGTTPIWPAPGCYVGVGDLQYNGPMETLDNAQIWSSANGSCSGADVFGPVTVFPATDDLDAILKCTDFQETSSGWVMDLSLYYAVPSGYWGCGPLDDPPLP